MSAYGSGCEDCVRCTECQEIAYCLSEPGTTTRPCPHDLVLCGDCLDACPDCRRAMEDEMFTAGEYDPTADPLFDQRAAARDDYTARMDEWRRESGFDAVTNSRRPRSTS